MRVKTFEEIRKILCDAGYKETGEFFTRKNDRFSKIQIERYAGKEGTETSIARREFFSGCPFEKWVFISNSGEGVQCSVPVEFIVSTKEKLDIILNESLS